MKDFRVMERIRPALGLEGQILFPETTSIVRVGKSIADSILPVAQSKQSLVVAVLKKKDGSFHRIGTLATIESAKQTHYGWEITLHGLARVSVEDFRDHDALPYAHYEFADETIDMDEATAEALHKNVVQISKEILAMIDGGENLLKVVESYSDVKALMAFCWQNTPFPAEEKQSSLELSSWKVRGLKLLDLLTRQKEALKLQIEMNSKISEQASKNHRENILREQLKTIREELGESKTPAAKDYREKIEAAQMPEKVKQAALEELEKLDSLGPQNPEANIVRNYLDLLTALPWADPEVKDVDLVEARKVLDRDHFGLEKVKDLIVQHLAVLKLKKGKKGAALLLVGPPGVGKTSLGQSIAKAMGREFVRASLGGVRDDAEIRGHRRTYLGALPGRIVQAMKRSGQRNPVFLLDEVDKLVRGWNGDPAAALLEVLDPEQNDSFQDHYLDLPYDLSEVFFIATANSTESIPGPLLDRMEVIQLTGYTEKEKFHIARDFLVPKQLELHGLEGKLSITDAALENLIVNYTREAGVRDLQRKIMTLCRVNSEKVVSAKLEDLPIVVTEVDLEERLGAKPMSHELAEADMPPGVVTGLAWTPVGGDILFIESTSMPGSGKLTLTGQLGDVMKESAQIAVSLVRSQLGVMASNFDFKETDLHIHVPSGGIPKDGPSAGTALFTTIASLVLGKKVDPKLAMTGEITLRGSVMPVGGIKEKLIAAHRAGIKRILLPSKNEKDLKDLPEEVRRDLDIQIVDKVSQVLQAVFGIPGLDAPLPASQAGQSPRPSVS